MSAAPIYLPLQFSQLLEVVQQLSVPDKKKLLSFLIGQQSEKEDNILTHFASENVLAKDWLTETEDEAWKDL